MAFRSIALIVHWWLTASIKPGSNRGSHSGAVDGKEDISSGSTGLDADDDDDDADEEDDEEVGEEEESMLALS
eukprot:evm.model.NODE_3366_length_53577_cov_19.425985.18